MRWQARSGCLISMRLKRSPVPGQEFVEPVDRVRGDTGQDVGQPGLRIDVVHLAVTMMLYMAAARCPPRSEPANSHDFLPSAIPRNARSAALLERQIRPSSRKRVNAVLAEPGRSCRASCRFARPQARPVHPRELGSSPLQHVEHTAQCSPIKAAAEATCRQDQSRSSPRHSMAAWRQHPVLP